MQPSDYHKVWEHADYVLQLNRELTEIKEKYMRIGMYKTGHAIEIGLQACGWELAGIIEQKAAEKHMEISK